MESSYIVLMNAEKKQSERRHDNGIKSMKTIKYASYVGNNSRVTVTKSIVRKCASKKQD